MIVELRDPIDPSRDAHTGLHRYIYPPEELEQLLLESGLVSTRVGHFLEYVFPETKHEAYMLHCRPPR